MALWARRAAVDCLAGALPATAVLSGADLVLESDEAGVFDLRVTPPGGSVVDVSADTAGGAFGERHHAPASWAVGTQNLLGMWTLQLKRTGDTTWDQLPAAAVKQAWLLLRFEAVA